MKHRRSIKRCTMPEINLTPLIDTALTLLVIFMVAAPLLQHNLKVNLPRGASSDSKEKEPSIIVGVLPSGVVLINDIEVERSQVVAVIKEAVLQEAASRVYMYADSAASYGSVIELFDLLKSASINSVTLALRPFNSK